LEEEKTLGLHGVCIDVVSMLKDHFDALNCFSMHSMLGLMTYLAVCLQFGNFLMEKW